jgi:hypothetical protein
MTLDPFSSSDEQGPSSLCLAIADHLAHAESDGASLEYLRANFTQYAADKVVSLRRHGWVIADDHDLDGDGRVFVLVHDPRDRAGA